MLVICRNVTRMHSHDERRWFYDNLKQKRSYSDDWFNISTWLRRNMSHQLDSVYGRSPKKHEWNKKKRKNSNQVSIPSQTSSGETFSSQKMCFADKKGLLASSWELKVKTKIDNSWADAVLELYRMKCRPRHIMLPPTHTNRKACDKIMVYGKLDCTYSSWKWGAV